MLDVLVGDAPAAGRLPRLDAGMDELVLVAQVVQAKPEQRVELVQRRIAIAAIGDVDAADPPQRIGHEAAQRFVDRGVEVHAGCVGARGSGDGGSAMENETGVAKAASR